jgi:hypothetical protein
MVEVIQVVLIVEVKEHVFTIERNLIVLIVMEKEYVNINSLEKRQLIMVGFSLINLIIIHLDYLKKIDY